MIGAVVKDAQVYGVPEPKDRIFNAINKGDHVIYYITRHMGILGIYKVTSNMKYLPDDEYWHEILVYEIAPIHVPRPGYALDLKKLLEDPQIHLDLFKNRERWARHMQGRTCIPLTENDYQTIFTNLNNAKYLKAI